MNDIGSPSEAAAPGAGRPDFPVVGIGASAGGVAALTTLFQHLPAAPGMAFVVLLQLPPQSELASALARVTSLSVEQVHESVVLQVDRVYVVAAALKAEIVDGRLRVAKFERPQDRLAPIDTFFRNLSDLGELAVGVVLSGAGADGSAGLRQVRETGGATLVQAPADAEHDGMPARAIATGAVDAVLPAAALGPRLVQVRASRRRIERTGPASPSMPVVAEPGRPGAESAERALADAMTLLRRLERHLQAEGPPSLTLHRDLLEGQPSEAQSLLKDLLTSVTEFLRDAHAVEAPRPPDAASLLRALEEELRRTRAELRGMLGESVLSNEELRVSNEELQAINEELQSTTEELETGREELQSVNEELVSVNQELKAKAEEADKVNDDLSNLIASTDIATVFVDRDLRIGRFTPSAVRLFNLIASDPGRSLLDITHRLDYPTLQADALEAFHSLRGIEREVRASDGNVYLARVRPYRTREDVIAGAALTFVDITAVRRAEERLLAGETNLKLMAESALDFAIITTDTRGRVNGWNIGARHIFGFEEAEITGKPIDLIFTPEDRAAGIPQKEMSRALTDGRGIDERWHVDKSGTPFYCSGIMTPMFRDGAHVGFSKIARERTEAKRAEAQMQALLTQEKQTRAELQRAIALKDEFLAVMSHELKQPLNLIHVNADLMSRLPEMRHAPAVARAADVIRRAVLSQAKIIDDLLDLSRLRTGKFGLAPISMDWVSAVKKVLDSIEGDAHARRLALTQEFEAASLPVMADPVRVEQIVWNLLSNAVKFTPPGGSIQVRLSADAGLARLDVTDTGQGISGELLPDVFDMFRQADRSTTRLQGGMGIGLALVRQLAEAQGGRVAAASAGLGQGARFSVWLPLLDGAGFDVTALAAPRALAGVRILVVDDTPDVLESFSALLRLEGAEVTPLHSAPEALAAVEHASFDLLLSDVAMPRMDGYELIATLRADPTTALLPAIALTGFGRAQDVRRAIEAGFDAHIAKPIVIDELLQTVQRLLASRREKPG